MPNWVTNKIKASPTVIQRLLGKNGDVDFNSIVSFPGEFPWDFISCAAETLAEKVVNTPISGHPLLGPMETRSRAEANLAQLDEQGFEQFVQMLRNHRQHGVFHQMDFARKNWGTKWNASNSRVNLATGEACFETAWCCPEPLLIELSRLFPEDPLDVVFADEDLGSNCGRFRLVGGQIVESDCAPEYRSMSDEQKAQWRAFAMEVTGRQAEDD